MVDTKDSALTEDTAPLATDMLRTIDDPAGTPLSKKSLISNVIGYMVTTAGDIIYATGSRVLARLGIGSAGGVLKVNAGATAPEWLAIGTAKHVLAVNAGATSPEWVLAQIDRGTSNPVSPASGDQFFRTDLGLMVYYDGTRWLTVHEYSHAEKGTVFSITGTITLKLRTDYAPYFTRCALTTHVATTNNATHYWQVLFRGLSLNLGAADTIYSLDTSGDSADTYTDHEGDASTPQPSEDHHIDFAFVKVDTPGNLTAFATAFYRLVIT